MNSLIFALLLLLLFLVFFFSLVNYSILFFFFSRQVLLLRVRGISFVVGRIIHRRRPNTRAVHSLVRYSRSEDGHNRFENKRTRTKGRAGRTRSKTNRCTKITTQQLKTPHSFPESLTSRLHAPGRGNRHVSRTQYSYDAAITSRITSASAELPWGNLFPPPKKSDPNARSVFIIIFCSPGTYLAVGRPHRTLSAANLPSPRSGGFHWCFYKRGPPLRRTNFSIQNPRVPTVNWCQFVEIFRLLKGMNQTGQSEKDFVTHLSSCELYS